jgi:uncharacterized membrane protein (UPF0127 family)
MSHRVCFLLTAFLFMSAAFSFAASVPLSLVCIKNACVHVDVVSKPEDMQRGLQGREGLKETQGMLFIFKDDDIHRFWMKDMKFSIDIIWMNNQLQIVTIVPSCPACTAEPCAIYSPSAKSRFVLEVPAGFSAKHQLKQGDIFAFKGMK